MLACFSLNASNIEYRVVGQQSVEDVSQSYFYDLLNEAFKTFPSPPNVQPIHFDSITQGRTLQLLADNIIDIHWTGTSAVRESEYRAIKVPLLMGLLGYRVSIINIKNKTQFNDISQKALQRKVACQGEHWPDTQILKHNGFSTMPVARFELMFKMVDAGHCDYFPRAIFEGYGELEEAQKAMSNLTMYDDTILYYPFPIYYFVHKNNESLAKDLESRLSQMAKSGELLQFMKQHSLTKHLFPLNKWAAKRFIHLENPTLPNNVEIKDTRYWLRLDSEEMK